MSRCSRWGSSKAAPTGRWPETRSSPRRSASWSGSSSPRPIYYGAERSYSASVSSTVSSHPGSPHSQANASGASSGASVAEPLTVKPHLRRVDVVLEAPQRPQIGLARPAPDHGTEVRGRALDHLVERPSTSAPQLQVGRLRAEARVISRSRSARSTSTLALRSPSIGPRAQALTARRSGRTKSACSGVAQHRCDGRREELRALDDGERRIGQRAPGPRARAGTGGATSEERLDELAPAPRRPSARPSGEPRPACAVRAPGRGRRRRAGDRTGRRAPARSTSSPFPAPADPQDVRQVHRRTYGMSTHAILVRRPPDNEPIHDYAPGQPGARRACKRGSSRCATSAPTSRCDRRPGRPHRRDEAGCHAARQGARAGRRPPGRRRARAAGDRRSQRGLGRLVALAVGGARRACSCARPSCSPARGATTLNAATMLGQSKTAHQAEIDAACESIDFFRFNVEFMTRLYSEQPLSRRVSGTGWSTARWRASSSRSRRSTSRRSRRT